MTLLIAGLALFFAGHIFTTFRGARAAAIKAIGERSYKIAYSAFALAGFALIIVGWGARPMVTVWEPPYWTRYVAQALMIPAMILLVAAYLPAGRIKAGAKHPMLAAVKIWAFAHLVANGDLASIVLFGAFLVYAVYDRIAVKGRAGTSPVVAGPARNDLIAVAVGLIAYAGFAHWLHPMWIGVSALP